MELFPPEITAKILHFILSSMRMKICELAKLGEVSKTWRAILTREKRKGHKTYIFLEIAKMFQINANEHKEFNGASCFRDITLGGWRLTIRNSNFYYLALCYRAGRFRLAECIGRNFYSEGDFNKEKFILLCAQKGNKIVNMLNDLPVDLSIKEVFHAICNTRGNEEILECIKNKFKFNPLAWKILLIRSRKIQLESNQIFTCDRRITF